MSRRRASPMDVDDLLSEILLRLPALTSSLPCASLVCTRWRRLVTDPIFLRRFRARHWKPLGVFCSSLQSGREHICFSFISDPPPGSILPDLFSVPAHCEDDGDDDDTWQVQGCRHGRVLLSNRPRYGRRVRQLLVWNPLAGEQHLLGVPDFFDDRDRAKLSNMQAAVICTFGDKGPFKVALAWKDGHSAHVCIYSSETGVWGDVVSASVRHTSDFVVGSLSVLLGNSLYWMLFGSYDRILEFDLGSQKLAVIDVSLPANAYANCCGIYLTTLARGGGLSLLLMSPNLRAQLWERTVTSDGVDQWMLGRTIELDKLLSLESRGFPDCRVRTVLGLVRDDNVMCVWTYRGVFMVHLKLMQFEKVFEANSFCYDENIHPFTNLYAPGTGLIKCSLGS